MVLESRGVRNGGFTGGSCQWLHDMVAFNDRARLPHPVFCKIARICLQSIARPAVCDHWKRRFWQWCSLSFETVTCPQIDYCVYTFWYRSWVWCLGLGRGSRPRSIHHPFGLGLQVILVITARLINPLMRDFYFQCKTWLVLLLRTSDDWNEIFFIWILNVVLMTMLCYAILTCAQKLAVKPA